MIFLIVSDCAKIKALENADRYEGYVKAFSRMNEISAMSEKITAAADGFEQKVNAILDWMNQNIAPGKSDEIEPYLVMKNKIGECQGQSNLFLALCRAANIIGRAVVGIIIQRQNTGEYRYFFHQWAELMIGDYWIPFDPTLKRRGIGLNYIKLLYPRRKIDILKIVPFLEGIRIEIPGNTVHKTKKMGSLTGEVGR